MTCNAFPVLYENSKMCRKQDFLGINIHHLIVTSKVLKPDTKNVHQISTILLQRLDKSFKTLLTASRLKIYFWKYFVYLIKCLNLDIKTLRFNITLQLYSYTWLSILKKFQKFLSSFFFYYRLQLELSFLNITPKHCLKLFHYSLSLVLVIRV